MWSYRTGKPCREEVIELEECEEYYDEHSEPAGYLQEHDCEEETRQSIKMMIMRNVRLWI